MCKFIYFISYWRVLQEKKIFARGHGVWLRRLAVTGLRRKFIAVRVVTLNYWSGRRFGTTENRQADTGPCTARWRMKCIKRFSADEWKEGCTYDEKFDCGCGNDDGINYCCGSANQTEAIEIWSQCLAGE